ncbi:MAG: QueT transporter family protein [Clostridia bacterium]|nr:QueT transporter family protein [Clostridia bacterium]
MKKTTTVRLLAITGLLAGMYTALTLFLAPVSFGLIQCRLSESLTILAAYMPAAIPALTLGCAISNLLGLGMGANPAGALDIFLGPLATGVAAWLSWRWRRYRIGGLPVLSTLPPVVLNAVIIGTELALVSPTFTVEILFIQMGLVAAGQLVACVGGGLLLAKCWEMTGLQQRLLGENIYK